MNRGQRSKEINRKCVPLRNIYSSDELFRVFSAVSEATRTISVACQQAKHIPNFCSNFSTALQAHVTTFSKQRGTRHRVKHRTVTKRLPVESVSAIQHHFVRMRPAALSLACAIEHVYESAASATIGMGNQNNRVLAFFREIESPNVELIFHSGNSRLQPLKSVISSFALDGVKYLSSEPRGNGSLTPFLTSVSVNLPLPSFSYAKTCIGLASGIRILLLASTFRIFTN